MVARLGNGEGQVAITGGRRQGFHLCRFDGVTAVDIRIVLPKVMRLGIAPRGLEQPVA